jgi:archaellin
MTCQINNSLDLCILPNQTFELVFYLKQDDGVTSIDLTNWSFTGSIKEQFADQTPVMFFTSSIVDVASGSVKLYLGASTTWQLTSPKYVYDVISNNENVTPVETLRILQGKISTRPGVTEP